MSIKWAVNQSGKGELDVDQSGFDQLTLHQCYPYCVMSNAIVSKVLIMMSTISFPRDKHTSLPQVGINHRSRV
jgi:hypothetical protein